MSTLPEGIVDLYVHAAPDPIARTGDDTALAAAVLAGGFRAAVHRHHYSPTAERSTIAAGATGAPLLGAILTNPTAGGLDPAPVELALRSGARWVGLPTLGARHFRRRVGTVRGTDLRFDTAELTLTDDTGTVRPQVHDILCLAAEAGVPVNLGYASAAECRAAAVAAREHGVHATVLTNPVSVIGLAPAEAAALLTDTGAFLEITAYSLHPSHMTGANRHAATLVELVRTVGVEQCVLSSDSGIAGAPNAEVLLGDACTLLRDEGFTEADLKLLLCANPATVLGV